MSSKPASLLGYRAQNSSAGAAPAIDVPALVPPFLESLPVMQWLSEAVHTQVQASVGRLRAGLRVARERLRDGRGAQFGAEEESAPLTVLLATDLEAFTPMLERLGDFRAQEIMHAHNEILRSCLRRHHGREVAHTGDGVLSAFRSPVDAVRCAIAMQRGLSVHNQRHPSTPLRVRIGLHAGVPLPEENRLFGTCVNVTVRVCSVAKPGAILVSNVVLRLLEGHVFRFVDRGPVALKGIRAPQELHEVVWQSQQSSPAAALPVALN
jgi:class 3 adenylate cyclase